MTEQEWLTCTDPTPMLEFLEGKSSDRKLRLFRSACCKRISGLLRDPLSDDALAMYEKIADGELVEANPRELAEAACQSESGTIAYEDWAFGGARAVLHQRFSRTLPMRHRLKDLDR